MKRIGWVLFLLPGCIVVEPSPAPTVIVEQAGSDAGTLGESLSDADASADAPAPPIEQLYVAVCLTKLAPDPSQALRLYVESVYDQGTLKMTMYPLRGWDSARDVYVVPSVSKTQVRGPSFDVEVEPAADGSFTAHAGFVQLVAEVNSISGKEVAIEGLKFQGRYGAQDRFCSTFEGQMTAPYSYSFGPDNVCLFVKAKEHDPVPDLRVGEFVCQ